MTRESRRADFTGCGGSVDLREGYEIKHGQPTKEFFDGFNAHVTVVFKCMRNKGYSYLDQCDERCMHP